MDGESYPGPLLLKLSFVPLKISERCEAKTTREHEKVVAMPDLSLQGIIDEAASNAENFSLVQRRLLQSITGLDMAETNHHQTIKT